MIKNFFGNLIDVLCLTSCGIFACIVTETVPVPSEGFSLPYEHIIGTSAALLLLLVFRRLTKMVWNVIYCIATIVLVAALLQWATKGLLMPPILREMVAPYSIPALLEGACYYELGSFALLWLMGALCSHGFWRVTVTAVGSYAVWLILSLGLHIIAKNWLNIEGSPLSGLKPIVHDFPWVTAAFPGCLVLCYAILMSMFDALFMGWTSTKDAEVAKAEEQEKKEEKKPESPSVSATATPAAAAKAATVKHAATPVAKAEAPTPAPATPSSPAPAPAPAPKENVDTPAVEAGNKPGDTPSPKV